MKNNLTHDEWVVLGAFLDESYRRFAYIQEKEKPRLTESEKHTLSVLDSAFNKFQEVLG
jgi:hypothetical protein